MRRRILILLASTLAFVGPTIGTPPARATTQNVIVDNFSFSPLVLRPTAGDTVTWTWAGGNHNVTAYGGAAFSSGDRSEAGSMYAQAFNGGTVYYRCTLHSFPGADGCHGMCGILTDDPNLDTQPPTATISRSDPMLFVSQPATFSGTATDDISVRSVELVISNFVLFTQPSRVVSVAITPGASVSWTANVSDLERGHYTVFAQATDTAGKIGQSEAINFTVL